MVGFLGGKGMNWLLGNVNSAEKTGLLPTCDG